MPDFIVDIIKWLDALPPWVQVVALLLVGAIPFVESYFGSLVGILLGINPFLVVPAVIIGNILCTFLLIALAGRARDAATRNRQRESAEQPSKHRERITKFLERFGVPGVCLLGPLVLASQITAPALVGLGAKRRSVYIWSGIAIIVWGVGTALLWTWILNAAHYEYLDYEGS